MNKNINRFTVEISSDLDYEKMVVNLNFFNNQFAILSCDQGINQTKIEVLDRYDDKVIWTFDYQTFLDALKLAYEKLKEANP